MPNKVITPAVFSFLKKLEKNNNRDWFTENKNEFKVLETEMKSFFNSIGEEVKTHDEIERIKVFRIYRDVRFSKDKTPYKGHFAGSFMRATAKLRGGYFIQIKPGETFLATGFWQPNKEDLFRIRKELELDASEFRSVIEKASFKSVWGALQGDEVKTAPKGFDKEHPDIDLIKKKMFIFVKKFTDTQVTSSKFASSVNDAFKAVRPYFNLMSEILTTNLNGESLLD